MSQDLIVIGRRALPTGRGTARLWEWECSLDDETGVEVYEERPTQHRQVKFSPVCVVSVVHEWVATEAVASEIANAVDGVVYSPLLGRICFEATKPVAWASRAKLEAHLKAVFTKAARAYFAEEKKAQLAEAKRFEAEPLDPKAHDWSDV